MRYKNFRLEIYYYFSGSGFQNKTAKQIAQSIRLRTACSLKEYQKSVKIIPLRASPVPVTDDDTLSAVRNECRKHIASGTFGTPYGERSTSFPKYKTDVLKSGLSICD